ncbi:haloacid dehalogenase type II [Marinobacterium sediminicola]|uniref:(S)-2-haloacid dehalogenase n=1 Tax=Marinobacterium sediminicola TaxID=518898 RepID=A0ABY1RXU0_9GAMM|nr:haloacid dehalogenase type II [Marinobacterium sediminicola]ULG67768.1 haloacid dehalogenase type II [Marinobacterium sediminicola]SMR71581.1 2-haloacid dehalogenase [Marinobacterium sediminicola]
MATTLAFDVYGTLIDTQGVLGLLQQMMGETAVPFSQTWRSKQLEYSFRRGLMRMYADFSVCTREALEYCCKLYQQPLNDEQKHQLMSIYAELPAFNDVAESLKVLKLKGYRLFAFSNGSASAVEGLLQQAGICSFFEGVVSVEEQCSFKPDPGVYSLFHRKAETDGGPVWLISGNPFDVIGAKASGMRAAWVCRSPEAVYDPWGIEPDVTVGSLMELPTVLLPYTARG